MKQNIKRTISLLLSVLLVLGVLTAFPLTASADTEIMTSGDWVFRYTYYIPQAHEEIDEPKIIGTAFVDYKGKDTVIKIPEKLGGYEVTSIDFRRGLSNITEIVIPRYVEYVNLNKLAFPKLKAFSVNSKNECYKVVDGILYNSHMTRLERYPTGRTNTSYTFPDSVYVNEGDAFESCDNLLNINLNNVQDIYLCGLKNLETIHLPSGIESFYSEDCPKLNSISVDAENPYFCSKHGILYNKSMTNLVKYPQGKKASEYQMPDSVTFDDFYAFNGTRYLKTLRASKNLTNLVLKNAASLESLYINAKLSFLNILGCNHMSGISVDAANTTFASQSGVLYTRDKTELRYYPPAKKATSYTLPDSVKSLSFPDQMINCKYLKEIKVGSGNKNFSASGGVLYNKNKTALVIYPSGKDGTSFKVPNGVTSVAESAFADNQNLKTLNMADSVKSLDFGTLTRAKNLTTINLSRKLEKIGYYVFEECPKLKSLQIPKSVKTISYGCIPENVTIFGYKGTKAEKYAKSTGNVFTDITPKSVKLNKTSLTLGVKESFTLKATLNPSNTVDILSYSSSNKNVATVDANGKVTAKKTGTAKITVKTSNGKTASCKVTVKKAPSKVKLSYKKKSNKVYSPVVKFNSGAYSYTRKYKSSNTKVAVVDAKGVVTIKKKGKATITLTTYNNKKSNFTFIVK